MTEQEIDMPYLLLAFEDVVEENKYYLDKQTGAVQLVCQDLMDLDDLTNEIEKDRERYLYIPKPDPAVLKEDLTDFADLVDDPHLKSLLMVALEGPNALFAFRKILSEQESNWQQWQDFRKEQVQLRIAQWLKANFIVSKT
jgi:hypothetical protein